MCKRIVALFDFDGVILDTETQYTTLWNKYGKELLGIDDFGEKVKGQSMRQIYGTYFKNQEELQEELNQIIHEYELNMSYNYIKGVKSFMEELRERGVPIGIVTSSDDRKMSIAYQAQPAIKALADIIVTSNQFKRSKPDPECFLYAMDYFNASPEETVIFEDSFHGIEAGRAAKAFVVGVSTTNKREDILPLCNRVIPHFESMNYKMLKEWMS